MKLAVTKKNRATKAPRDAAPGTVIALSTVLPVLLLVVAVAMAIPAGARAEQASQPSSPAAGQVDAGGNHSCALVAAAVRCWGRGVEGQLGYGNGNRIGDDETPDSVGPVSLGPGRTATAISAGDFHTCALVDDGTVRCWGLALDGRLGYGNTTTIGDDETPDAVAPVSLGPERAVAITAGGAHTCALLADGTVRCWGFGDDGRLGYGDRETIGDNETPASIAPVSLGPARAVAITAGGAHTCALLADRTVRCWGTNGDLFGGDGRLGYGDARTIGDDETPGSLAEPVKLGQDRTATAISAGDFHTCAVLDDDSVRCWGLALDGRLGYAGNPQRAIGDNEHPGSVGPVSLGQNRTATAISAGRDHTCARLNDGNVRCWGRGIDGQLGYGNENNVGDNETPGSVGPVNIGLNLIATSISAGERHTCARLDDDNVRCWGYAGNGRLGYCNLDDIGDDESPGSVGPVRLDPARGGARCVSPSGGGGSGSTPGTGGGQTGGGDSVSSPSPTPSPQGGGDDPDDPLAVEALRTRNMRTCLAAAKRAARSKRGSARRSCLKRYGRTPGRVKGLKARAASKNRIMLSFTAPGTDGARPPAARAYLIKQSPRAIRRERDFTRAQSLCKGSCRFTVTRVGTTVNLTITDLRPKTTYYYAIAARDNVSKRLGPRSAAVKTKTR